MKINLFNKDKGLKPPTGAFDFRPNRTVDSNPKLDNMKGDYMSPKNRRKRKYYTGGYFDKYASKYSQLAISPDTSHIKITKYNKFPSLFNSSSKISLIKDEESSEQPKYSVTWEGEDTNVNYDLTLPELLTNEGFQFKVSSGYRQNAKTYQGKPSNHSLGNALNPGAYDIVPLATSYDEFEQRLYSNPRVLAWLDKKGWGTLKENALLNGQRGFLRTDGTFANTGASGDHFHFGPDKGALEWKEVNRKKYARS